MVGLEDWRFDVWIGGILGRFRSFKAVIKLIGGDCGSKGFRLMKHLMRKCASAFRVCF